MFALLAIRLFGDKLYSCNDGAITTGRQDCIGNFYNGAGILMPRVWDKPDYNFDSLGKVRLGGGGRDSRQRVLAIGTTRSSLWCT